MRKAINKDFFREIKNTFSRYLSLILIVTLGVAFFAGIRATAPDMKLSLDEYLDDTNYMDIRVISTLGLTDDVEAISGTEGVTAAEGSFTYDAYVLHDEEKPVVHFISEPDRINQMDLVEGREIRAGNECIIDQELAAGSGFELGDELFVVSAYEDEDVLDTLCTDTFTVVGIATSSSYFTFSRDTTSIGNGQTDGFAYLSRDAFVSDVYTLIYVLADGAADEVAFSDKYEAAVDAVSERIEAISPEREAARYDQIMSDAQSEIDDARRELEDGRAEADKELADAWQEITDGQQELEDGYRELADAREEYETQIADAEKELSDAATALDQAEKEIADNEKMLADGWNQYYSGLSEAEEGQAQLDEGYEQLSDAVSALGDTDALKEELNLQKQALEAELEELEEGVAGLERAMAFIGDLEEERSALESALEEAQSGIEIIEDAIASIDGYLAEIASLELAVQYLDEQQAVLDAAFEELALAKAELESGDAQLAAAKKAVKDGRAELEDGWNELYIQMDEAEEQFAEAEAELEDGKAELEDGIEEYYKGKEEAEAELADAEEQIAEAEAELAELSYPEWYVLDRNSTQGYVEYGQNAERIGAIGDVFPVIFFLVAALMSLTTMTRMVDSERTQIGTLKALGYGNWAIARKYVFYALSASVIGSLIGMYGGQKLLPWIIIYAYKVMYPNLPRILVPINAGYTVMATGAAIICVTGAAFYSCYRSLMSPAADLMRPEAPKVGKKIWIEHFTFVWKRLKFTSKVALRNLFRYTRRFLMTVLGIAGCTAMVFFSFGLTDSINGVVDKQYTELYKYDITLSLASGADDEELAEMTSYLDDTEDMDVDSYIFVRSRNIELQGEKGAYTAYLTIPGDVEAYKDFVVFRDRKTGEGYELDDGSVIITEKLSELLNLGVGDTITVEDGDLRADAEIGAIMENYLMSYIFMSPDYYESLFGQAPGWNTVDAVITDLTGENSDFIAENLLSFDAVSGVTMTTSTRKTFDDVIDSLGIITVVLLVSAGLLAFVVLYNLNNINITERRRELATIRVLGFYDMELAMYIYRENIMLTVIGALAGLLLGTYIHSYIITLVENEVIMFVRHAQPLSYLYSLLVTFAFALFVNWIMYFRLRKIDMVESLKSVE